MESPAPIKILKTRPSQIRANKKYYESIKNDPIKVAERKAKQNANYQLNKEKLLARSKEYNEKNKDKITNKRLEERKRLEEEKLEKFKKQIIEDFLKN